MRRALEGSIATAAVGVAIITVISACGGGAGKPAAVGPPLASYSTPTQAAAAASISQALLNLLNLETEASDRLRELWEEGGANGLAGSRIVHEDLTELAHPFLSVDVTKDCPAGGTVSETGTIDTASGTLHVVFAGCRRATMSIDGTADLSWTKDASTGAKSSHAVEHYTERLYLEDTFTTLIDQRVRNNTTDIVDDGSSGSHFEDGTIVETFESGKTTSIALIRFGSSWTSTSNPDGSTTKVTDVSGTTKATGESGVTLTVTNAVSAKVTSLNDAAHTRREWPSGSITMAWDPEKPSDDCVPGRIEMSTLEEDPVVYDDTHQKCPASGTFTMNGAKFEYGTSGGVEWPAVVVTIGGSSQTYLSCEALNQAAPLCNGLE